ncbi:MAG: methylenetetrahydrofolate reductase [Woeseiaceae bacterium]
MKRPTSESDRLALIDYLRDAYMEVFPAGNIEQRLSLLEPHSYVAVTCSPTKGVEVTLELTEKLVNKGFRVIPHLAARNVMDQSHLGRIMQRLSDLQIESIFVPGGDRSQPIGRFATAFELLKAISSMDHGVDHIGVAAHPEGHPEVPSATLFDELRKKQELATYMVTQMCFDTAALGTWLANLRARGITLPVWIGLPGVIDRGALLKTSFKIGVGDSLRFLRKKSSIAKQLMKPGAYIPDDLVIDFAKYHADPDMNIAGYHLFCFNQIESTERWRQEAIESLR